MWILEGIVWSSGTLDFGETRATVLPPNVIALMFERVTRTCAKIRVRKTLATAWREATSFKPLALAPGVSLHMLTAGRCDVLSISSMCRYLRRYWRKVLPTSTFANEVCPSSCWTSSSRGLRWLRDFGFQKSAQAQWWPRHLQISFQRDDPGKHEQTLRSVACLQRCSLSPTSTQCLPHWRNARVTPTCRDHVCCNGVGQAFRNHGDAVDSELGIAYDTL